MFKPAIETDAELLADLLEAARKARVCIHPFAEKIGLSQIQAYEIQRHLVARRHARGEFTTGMKLGFTSEAMRQQMGISGTNVGLLTDAMLVGQNGLDSSKFIHPRAEPEVALKLACDIRWPIARSEIEDCIAACAPAIEIVDSRFHDYCFTLQDNTADNSSAAAYILGDWCEYPRDLRNRQVILTVNGDVTHEGNTSAAIGNPLNALVEGVRLAETFGFSLPAGTVILTGGLTAAPYIRAGQNVVAHISGLGSVSLKVN